MFLYTALIAALYLHQTIASFIVSTKASTSCSLKSSITVNGMEESKQQFGINVVAIDTKDGTVESVNFNENMGDNIFQQPVRIERRKQFLGYFRKIKNGTVIVITTQGLCKSRNFGNWRKFIMEDTNLHLVLDTARGSSKSAILIACQRKCPLVIVGNIPLSIYGKELSINSTFALKGYKNDRTDMDNEENILLIICCTIAAILVLFLFILIIICFKRRNQQINKSSPPIGEEELQIYDEINEMPSSEYQTVFPPKKCSSHPDVEDYQGLVGFRDGDKSPSSESTLIQNCNYQCLENGGDSQMYAGLASPQEERSENIYTYIQPKDNKFPGSSHEMFKKSLESLNMNVKSLNKENFSSYIKVDAKSSIYKQPSSVPKYTAPNENPTEVATADDDCAQASESVYDGVQASESVYEPMNNAYDKPNL